MSARSTVDRVDVPIPYEPDQDIVPFEEADLATRVRTLLAATWLFDNWPERFIDCCVEAQIQYPALNRNSIAVREYGEAAFSAYTKIERSTLRKSVTGDRLAIVERKRA